MSEKNLEERVNQYINQIGRLFPYKEEIKGPVIDALREEVMEAMNESEDSDPVVVYGAPREVAKNVSLSQDWGKRASLRRRAFAYLVDLMILSIILMPTLTIMIFSLLAQMFPQLADIFQQVLTAGPSIQVWLWLNAIIVLVNAIFLLEVLIISLVSPIYFVVLERLFSTTLAKKWLGLKVCDISGIQITLRQAILRNFSKLSAVLLILDAIIGRYAKNGEQQRVLDLIAETIVLKT